MKLNIGTRLGLGFLIMLLLVAAAGIASILTVQRLSNLTTIMVHESGEVLEIGEIGENLSKADAALGGAVASGTDGEIATARFRQSELNKIVTSYLDRKKSSDTASQEKGLSSLKGANQVYNILYETYLNLIDIRSYHDLVAFSNNIENALGTYLFALAELRQSPTERMSEALDGITRAQSALFTMMAMITIVAALLGAGLAIGIARSITKPVQRIVAVADKISMGDLETAIVVTSRDEIGELQESIERMRLSIKTAMELIRKKR